MSDAFSSQQYPINLSNGAVILGLLLQLQSSSVVKLVSLSGMTPLSSIGKLTAFKSFERHLYLVYMLLHHPKPFYYLST